MISTWVTRVRLGYGKIGRKTTQGSNVIWLDICGFLPTEQSYSVFTLILPHWTKLLEEVHALRTSKKEGPKHNNTGRGYTVIGLKNHPPPQNKFEAT